MTTASEAPLRRSVAAISAPALLTVFFIAAGTPTPLTALYETQRDVAPWVLTVAFGVYAFGLITDFRGLLFTSRNEPWRFMEQPFLLRSVHLGHSSSSSRHTQGIGAQSVLPGC